MSIASQLSFSTATSLLAGAAGSIPYQASVSNSTFLAIGTNGYVLTSNGSAPTWTIASGVTSGTATNAINILTVSTATNASFYPTFVNLNTSTPAYLSHYTTGSFAINPYTGYIGIGLTPVFPTPPSPLSINSTATVLTSPSTVQLSHGSNNWGLSIKRNTAESGHPNFSFIKSRAESTATIVSGDGLGRISWHASTATAVNQVAELGAINSTVWAGDGVDSNIYFNTRSTATGIAERMRIDFNGYVGIGTSSPSSWTNGKLVVAATSAAPANIYLARNFNAQITQPTIYTNNDAGFFSFYQGDTNVNFARYLDIVSDGSVGTANSNIRFWTNISGAPPTEKMRIDAAGNVGINTTSSQALLHVNSGTIRVQNFAAAPYIDTYAAEGTPSTPTATGVGRQIASLRGFGYDGTSYIFGGGLDLQAETLWSVGSNATYLRFRTSPAVGSGTEQMRITSTGGISFGASGTAYGTSGQILQSNGNASPTWISTGSLVASNAIAVQTVLTATNVNFFPTFVSTNNSTPAALFHYTTSSFAINPNSGNLYVGNATQQLLFSVNSQYSGPSIVPFGSINVLYLGPGGTKTVVGGNSSAYNGTLAVRQISGQPAFTVEDSGATLPWLYVNSTGNVGIGTSSPSYPLHISSSTGQVYLTSSVGTNYVRYIANNTGGSFQFGIDNSAGSNFFGSTAYGRAIFSDGAYPVGIFTNGTERMRITANGGIAFGGAANYGVSGQILQSNGDAAPTWVTTGTLVAGASSQLQTVLQAGNATYYPTFVSTNNASAAAMSFYTTSSFNINPGLGYVNIGNSGQAAKLYVELTGQASMATFATTATTNFAATARMGFSGLTNNSDGVYFGMGANATGIPAGFGFFREASGWNTALAFYTNNVTSGPWSTAAMQEKMRIDSSGNVGIGTNSPSAKLSVAGNALIGTQSSTRIDILGSGGGTAISETYLSETTPRWAIGRDTYAGGQAGIGFGPTSNVTIAAGGAAVGIPATSTLGFATSNGTALTERMRIDSSGNVGIGSYGTDAGARVLVQNTGSQNTAWFRNFSGTRATSLEVSDWPWPVMALSAYGNFYRQNMLSFTLPNDAISQTNGIYHTDNSVWNFSLNGVTGVNSWDNASGSTTPAQTSTTSTGLQLLGPGNLRLGTDGGVFGNIYFRTNSTDRAVITAAGTLCVGTTVSGAAGEIRATNEITAYYTSDIRLKENIKPIEDPITMIDQIRGVYFDWTDEHMNSRGGEDGYFVRKHDIGVIAQEIEAILPEIVATRDNGFKAVKYEKIVPLLIEAIKAQQKQIDQIQATLAELLNK